MTPQTCEAVRDRLIDHYYRELDLQGRRDVALHLNHCTACAVEYCRLDATLSGLDQACDEAPPPALQQQLRQRVDRAFRLPWWRRLWRMGVIPVPAYQTALLLLAVMLAWLLVGPRSAGPVHDAPVTRVVQGYDASRIVTLNPNVL